jgi:hypothetical protein
MVKNLQENIKRKIKICMNNFDEIEINGKINLNELSIAPAVLFHDLNKQVRIMAGGRIKEKGLAEVNIERDTQTCRSR